MDTIGAAAAAVTGAAHLRAARNGQDAAIASVGEGHGVVVVCDGCSSGASSEVGARLGANLFARAIARRVQAGESPSSPALWAAARNELCIAIDELVDRMPGDRAGVIHDYFLFTIVAAAVTRDGAAVWCVGDGTYLLGDTLRVLGPFADNQPPYLGYDLLGEPAEAHFAVAAPCSVVVATDGASELPIARFADDRFIDHPDALRRWLTVLARATERIDWDERRVVRTSALVQDDIAVGLVRWRPA